METSTTSGKASLLPARPFNGYPPPWDYKANLYSGDGRCADRKVVLPRRLMAFCRQLIDARDGVAATGWFMDTTGPESLRTLTRSLMARKAGVVDGMVAGTVSWAKGTGSRFRHRYSSARSPSRGPLWVESGRQAESFPKASVS